jgi:hypothetical protein
MAVENLPKGVRLTQDAGRAIAGISVFQGFFDLALAMLKSNQSVAVIPRRGLAGGTAEDLKKYDGL